MICGAKIQVSALDLKNLLPEIDSENRVTICYNIFWNAMGFKDIINKELSDHGSFKGVL
jgi:hypothetical protein